MGSINFIPGTTVTSAWLNDVDSKVFGDTNKLISLKNELFGVVGDGTTDDTDGIQAWLDYLVANSCVGYIPDGSYGFKGNRLTLDNGFTDKTFPIIWTGGANAVTFKRLNTANGPFLQVTNGTATSGSGKYWKGGYFGGFTIDQNGQATSSGQHGVVLRGVEKTVFGRIVGNGLGGSTVYIPPALYGGTNPDPYAVYGCDFESIEGINNKLYAFQNDNYVGFNLCTVRQLRVVGCETGGFFGFGAANKVLSASMGSVKGWAFDDGTDGGATGGSPSRFYIGSAELDDVQYGIRLNKTTIFTIGEGVRFVHRYNFSALNPGEGYWPRKAMQFAGGSGPNVSMVTGKLWHRVEAGGAKINMGTFLDFSSNGNSTDIEIDQRVSDNAGFGFTDTDLYSNVLSIVTCYLKQDGYKILDQRKKHYVKTNATVATTVANSGFGVTKTQFPTEVKDDMSLWNGADTATIKSPGQYRVFGKICLATGAVGTRVRMGVMVNGTMSGERYMYSQIATAQHYELDDILTLNAGDTVSITADQNTATASIAVSAPTSVGVDNYLMITLL
jgi:hypothetical protein